LAWSRGVQRLVSTLDAIDAITYASGEATLFQFISAWQCVDSSISVSILAVDTSSRAFCHGAGLEFNTTEAIGRHFSSSDAGFGIIANWKFNGGSETSVWANGCQRTAKFQW
jgi:hypothetical protein